MSNIKNEVIQKLRSDIRSKLDQIGAFVDNELADYIMVLVANQKTKYQMKDDLSLFLGKETDDFVNWLHLTLKNMQLTAIHGEDRKLMTSKKADPVKDETQSSSNKTKVKTKAKVEKLVLKSDKTIDSSVDKIVNEEIITQESNDDLIDSMKSPKSVNAVSPQLTINTKFDSNDSQKLISNQEIDKNEKLDNDKEQNDGEVVLHLNPDGGEVDELLQESDVNEVKNAVLKEAKVKPLRHAKVESLRRQPISSGPSSTIGAVVKNPPQEEDDEVYDPARPTVGNVASVVRITERKSSVPIEMQANKMLLLRAVKEANQSTLHNRKRSNEDIEYTPTPIKRRLGERQQTADNVEESNDLDPEDLRNYLNITKKDSDKSDAKISSEFDENLNNSRIVKQIKSKEIFENPQFVVTLDGVDHNKFFKNSEITDDEILLDEEMDDEFIETEDIGVEEQGEDSINSGKLSERCRYWPACKNGDQCEFQHPTTPCKAFPNCRFGEKCLFIHPNCKFDAMCSRKDCPFTHASKRKIPSSPAIIPSLLPPSSVKPCKYFPNCKNTACPYYHPKICHFGAKCRSAVCPFVHPNTSYAMPSSVPHPHQLKWKAKDHISERAFALQNPIESTTTTSS